MLDLTNSDPLAWAGERPPEVSVEEWEAAVKEANAQMDLEESVEFPDLIKHLEEADGEDEPTGDDVIKPVAE